MRVALAHTTSITPWPAQLFFVCRLQTLFAITTNIYDWYSFFTNINAQVRQLFFIGLDVKVKENKETLNLLSLLIKFVCEISHVADNYSTNLAVNLAGVLYFGIFLKNYTSYIYIGMVGVLL
jgi:hypothetical protein